MINDVDETLRALVRRDVLNGANVDISFEAPSKEWSARRNAPALSLYLYEIREDLERREVQYEEVRDERGIVVDRRLPPRRFKLSYLVTAWTQRPDDEHRLLSSTLSCFLRFDALPSDVLQGELSAQPYPVRVTVGLPLPPERSISDVWTALGGELKPSLDLVITVPFDTRRQQHPVGPPVLEEPRINLSGPAAKETPARPKRRGGRGAKGPDEAPVSGTEARTGDADDQASASGRDSGKADAAGPAASARQGGPGHAEGSEPEAVASEVRHGGKGPAGRTFKVRMLPRS